MFDFNNIARKHPNARLDHAFRLAQEHLDIERLLDPEGNLFQDTNILKIISFIVWLKVHKKLSNLSDYEAN